MNKLLQLIVERNQLQEIEQINLQLDMQILYAKEVYCWEELIQI